MYKPPPQGFGLHDWILETSRQLVLEGLSQAAIEQSMFDACLDCGRPFHILRKEIHDAVCGALEWAGKTFDDAGKVRIAGGGRKSVEWLPVNVQKQSEVLQRMDLYCYKTLVEDADSDTGKFSYEHLFAKIDFNLCCAVQMNQPIILPLSKWLNPGGFGKQQFIVPNPMLTIKGKKSNDNTHKQLYQIVEFDFKQEKEGDLQERKDKQARLIRWLMSKWALAMVVWSGSKSLHAWFPCYHKTTRQIRNFVRLATELGADRQMRIPCQYCRMPNGWNYKTESRQQVVYYDWNVINQHNCVVQEDLCGVKEGNQE